MGQRSAAFSYWAQVAGPSDLLTTLPLERDGEKKVTKLRVDGAEVLLDELAHFTARNEVANPADLPTQLDAVLVARNAVPAGSNQGSGDYRPGRNDALELHPLDGRRLDPANDVLS